MELRTMKENIAAWHKAVNDTKGLLERDMLLFWSKTYKRVENLLQPILKDISTPGTYSNDIDTELNCSYSVGFYEVLPKILFFLRYY